MADLDEDNFYLQPGFDPQTLTMPKLRNIFFQHDIPYPSGAKKPQLVEIFEAKLRPKAKRILAQQARVKRTSMGIQDMSSQSSVEQDEDPDPEPPVTRRTTRKSSAAPSTTSTRSRTSRRSTRTPATDAGHTEDEAESVAGRRSRFSTVTPVPETSSESGTSTRGGRRRARLSDFDPPTPTQVKEEPEDEDQHTPKGPSPFTMDNPFQSGSSPAEDATTPKPSRKSSTRRPVSRSSNAHVKDEEVSFSVAKGKKTRGSSARLGNGAVKQSRSRTVSIEPGEEFTQEEQDELDSEEEASGQAVMPPRKKKSGVSGAARTGPLVVLTTILAGFGVWWRQEKISAGYCGLGSSGEVISLSNSNVELPEWLSGLQPQCEPCPQHAICYPDFEARCEPDFVLKHHPLSLGGLVPLAPTCEPDSEKARKVKAVADRAIEELREQRAKYECGSPDEEGKAVSTPGLNAETLRARVSARRRKGMTELEFEELWKGAIGDVKEREEVTQEKDGRRAAYNAHGDAAVLFSSSSLARLSLPCFLRRRARVTLARYRVPSALVMLLGVGLWYARRRLRAFRSDRARVPDLVSVALDRLATQAALQDLGRSSEPHISMVGLRDDLLRDEFSAGRRDRIWSRVKHIVEANANVRAGVKEGRSGDVSRVWEWTGPLPQIDDGYSSGYDSRRTSGRFSLGPTARSEESLLSNASAARTNDRADGSRSASPMVKKEDEALHQHRKWDEGRPVY